MKNPIQQFINILDETELGSCERAIVPILDSGLDAVVLKVDASDAERQWLVARKLLPNSKRWPLLSVLFSPPQDKWQATVEEADLFSRFYFNEEKQKNSVSPADLIVRSKAINFKKSIEKAYEFRAEYRDLESELDLQIQDTKSRYGEAPSRSELLDMIIATEELYRSEKIDRLLFDWEAAHSGGGKVEEARLEWFYDDPCALVFLPTSKSWEALAYMHWYGASELGSEFHIAMHRMWFKEYGAELCSHHGTMLQFFVNNPPETDEKSWELANTQDLISPSTLSESDITVRKYAFALRNHDRWFFHERP